MLSPFPTHILSLLTEIEPRSCIQSEFQPRLKKAMLTALLLVYLLTDCEASFFERGETL